MHLSHAAQELGSLHESGMHDCKAIYDRTWQLSHRRSPHDRIGNDDRSCNVRCVQLQMPTLLVTPAECVALMAELQKFYRKSFVPACGVTPLAGQRRRQHDMPRRQRPLPRRTPGQRLLDACRGRTQRRRRGEQAMRVDAAHAEGGGASGAALVAAGQHASLLQTAYSVSNESCDNFTKLLEDECDVCISLEVPMLPNSTLSQLAAELKPDVGSRPGRTSAEGYAREEQQIDARQEQQSDLCNAPAG